MLEQFKLGASLYIPSTHKDLLKIANGDKYEELKSMIFCTEDSISDDELSQGLANLKESLPAMKATEKLRFIRVRNPSVLQRILMISGVENIDGFVLPKVTADNILIYLSLLERTKFKVMVTLETKEVFDRSEMIKLRSIMLNERHYSKILALRIGGNDLLNILGVRRPKTMTIYETPLGGVISDLITIFKPYGFFLTSPVFEYIKEEEVLKKELEKDLAHGLIGKTAIHPSQIQLIELAYKISKEDDEMATSLLDSNSLAVFKMHDSMCELATHFEWAKNISFRKDIYGIKQIN